MTSDVPLSLIDIIHHPLFSFMLLMEHLFQLLLLVHLQFIMLLLADGTPLPATSIGGSITPAGSSSIYNVLHLPNIS